MQSRRRRSPGPGAGTCLAVLIAAACATATPPSTPGPALDAARYFPLDAGTLWVYAVSHPGGQVELRRVFVRGPRYLRSRGTSAVVVDESGGGYEELALDSRWHPVAYYAREGFLYKFDGLLYEDAELREVALGDGEEPVMPLAPLARRTWRGDFRVFWTGEAGYGLLTRAVARPAVEPVRVRAGTYTDCLRVDTWATASSLAGYQEEPRATFHYVDWYAPDVGLVRSVVRLADDEERLLSASELVSFRAAPRPAVDAAD